MGILLSIILLRHSSLWARCSVTWSTANEFQAVNFSMMSWDNSFSAGEKRTNG